MKIVPYTPLIVIVFIISVSANRGQDLQLTILSGRKYYFGDSYFKTWSQAQTFCRSNNMEMISIESRAENDRIKNHLNVLKGLSDDIRVLEAIWWIGASDVVQEGRFIWSGTGRPAIYTNWAPGEPNNRDQNQHYVGMQLDGTWGDYTGSGRQGKFICEKERN